ALVHGRKRLDPRQRAFQLADVALHLVRYEAQNVFGNQAVVVAELGVEDGEPGLEVRGLYVGDETPLESRAQPVLESRYFLWRTIGRDDDLLVDLVQRIEGVEELLLGAVLACKKLDVIDQQHIDGAVLVAELAHARGGDGADDFVRELLRRQIDDPLAWETVVDLMADRVHEMCLAEPHASIKEKWVVAVARGFGDRLRGGVSELRVVADHER